MKQGIKKLKIYYKRSKALATIAVNQLATNRLSKNGGKLWWKLKE